MVHHYEYVFQPGAMYVYDMDDAQRLVQEVTGMHDTEHEGMRGVMVDPATSTLYISHGGDAEGFDGSLLAYDLVTGSALWNKLYSFPVDSGAITPDGTTIYMPTGEDDPSGIWNVLNAASGEPIGSIKGPANAHNTIVSLDGKYVFLGGRESNYLYVASTATNEVIQKIGPLAGGVRPFTVNGTDALAYTTATGFLGFQVSSIATGKVLYTVQFPGTPTNLPSHGITLTPDEQQLYVMDAVHETVHVFDVSRVPASAPVQIAEIKLSQLKGNEEPCAYDCVKSGWLQASRDGRFVYVGDTGDVIDTQTLKIVATLAPLAQTREMLEIDWANGVPVATTSRYGLGYVTSLSEPPKEEIPVEPPPQEPPMKEPHGEPPSTVSDGASSPSGVSSPTPSLSPPALVAPIGGEPGGVTAQVEDLRIDPAAFRIGGAGARISYTDSLPARAAFTVLRAEAGVEDRGHRCVKRLRHAQAPARRRCALYVPVASFAHSGSAARNGFAFSGRIAGRWLSRGLYRLQVRPVFDGRSGTLRTVSFRIMD